MSKRDSLLAIDYVKNVAGGTSRVVSGGGGSIDTSGFLLLDGSRAMTGNLDMGGFNVSNVNLLDGIDLPAHVANANAHHNRQHDLDSASDHTGTLAWASVNKTGSNLTDIVTRTHNSLQSIGENDHHNRSHSITSASDHTVTGSAFDLVGLSAPNTLAILTPSANVQSGIERILKSTSAGNLGLASLTTPLINASANLTIQPTGDIVLDPQGNDVLPSLNYDINLGAINKKYLTLHAAELWVETLVAQNTIATIGGRILVGPTTYLTRDIGTGDTTIYVRHNQMISGDRVYMEANGFVEFFAITSGATTISATEFSYTVTRNLDGSGANTWYAGDAMFNTGQTGNGFIDLYSIRGVKTASQYGPTIVGNIRNSSTYNDWTESWAIGNLNGLYGYGTNLYGAGFGKYESGKPNIVIDPTNGVRLRQYTTDMIVLDASGSSYFAGVMTLGTSGEIRQGTGTVGVNYTGLRLWRDSNVGRIGGYNNGTLQWYGDTSGNLVAGTGNVTLNANGIRVLSYHDTRTSTPEPGYSDPITTPNSNVTYYSYDQSDSWFSAVDGTINYGGGTVLRMFGSSSHAVDSGQPASQWSHYVDGVIEMVSVTKPAGDTGTWRERLWLKAPSTNVVLYNGGLGINTAYPGAKLDVTKAVSGTSFVPHIRVSDTGTVASTKGGIEFYNSTYSWVQGRIATERQASGNEHDLVLYGGSGGSAVEVLRLGHDGYVGINYNAPFYPLHVFYNNPTSGIVAEFRNTHGASGNLGVKLSFSNSGVDAFRIGMPDATADFAFWSSEVNERVRITSSGNVGIGTASPGSALDVRTGIIRVGNTSDLFSAKIQTSGNIHAQGAITSEAYFQNVAASAPAGVLGYARLYLESLGANRYRLRCIMRNEYNTADVNTVLAQNY